MNEWKTLGLVAPNELVESRLQLHYAAQVVASAGLTFLEAQPDDGHPNFAWGDALQAFAGRKLPVSKARVGLRVADLTLLLMDEADGISEEFLLEGERLETAYAWLAAATKSAGEAVPSEGIIRSEYEIPSHPIQKGEVFSSAPHKNLVELARWFANVQ